MKRYYRGECSGAEDKSNGKPGACGIISAAACGSRSFSVAQQLGLARHGRALVSPCPAIEHRRQRAAVPDGSASKGMITPKADEAIDRGLAYLNASRQRTAPSAPAATPATSPSPAWRRWPSWPAATSPAAAPTATSSPTPCSSSSSQENATAQPGFPAQPRRPRRTARCTATASPRCSWPRSTAWSTTEPAREARDKLQRAVELILNSQNSEGGWRYQPDSQRRRHLGDHLPDHGPARRPQRRLRRAEVEGRSVRPSTSRRCQDRAAASAT